MTDSLTDSIAEVQNRKCFNHLNTVTLWDACNKNGRNLQIIELYKNKSQELFAAIQAP